MAIPPFFPKLFLSLVSIVSFFFLSFFPLSIRKFLLLLRITMDEVTELENFNQSGKDVIYLKDVRHYSLSGLPYYRLFQLPHLFSTSIARQKIYPFPSVSLPLPLLCSFNLSFSIKLFRQIFDKSKFGK